MEAELKLRLADGSVFTDLLWTPITSEELDFEFSECKKIFGSEVVEVELRAV